MSTIFDNIPKWQNQTLLQLAKSNVTYLDYWSIQPATNGLVIPIHLNHDLSQNCSTTNACSAHVPPWMQAHFDWCTRVQVGWRVPLISARACDPRSLKPIREDVSFAPSKAPFLLILTLCSQTIASVFFCSFRFHLWSSNCSITDWANLQNWWSLRARRASSRFPLN